MPSLPLQPEGDQAVDAHATRAPAPPYSGGRVWSIVSRGDDRALLGLWGGEAEETGHRERGEGERGERRRREEKRRG